MTNRELTLREAAQRLSDKRSLMDDGFWVSQREMRYLDAALAATPPALDVERTSESPSYDGSMSNAPKDAHHRAEIAPALDVERLARAMVASGLMHRYSEYALAAHPTTMTREADADVARTWASGIADEYAALSTGAKP